MGANNRGCYSNPNVDRHITEALSFIDDPLREALLREATEIAMRDFAVLPPHWLSNAWATQSNITYAPRMDGFTPATSAKHGPDVTLVDHHFAK